VVQKPRSPVVAGSFYPSSEATLRDTIKDCFLGRLGPGKLPLAIEKKEERNILGLISPHAGYMYSGPVAAHGYYQLGREKKPQSVVIIGPNHTGLGPGISIYPDEEWVTPLGRVRVNESLAQKIITASDAFSSDKNAHILEHSIEVQLPFLQFLYEDDFEIVPICMRDQTFETSYELGKAISESSKENDPLIIASTDFTHYESADSARKKDQMALEAILRLDADGLLQTVYRIDISMCGAGPVAAMLTASRGLGAKKVELIAYQTSGDVTGDLTAVVGYASVKVTK
jgi:AmmeMemoRadiSam system protein B